MNAFAVCLAVVGGCYLISALGTGLALIRHNQLWKTTAARLSGGAFALHSLGLALLPTGLAPWNDTYFLHIAAWLFVLTYVLIRKRLDTAFLTMVCAGPAGLLVLTGLIMEEARFYQLSVAEHFSGPLFALHVAFSFAAIASMLVGCGAGLAFIYMDNKLKRKSALAALDDNFPALTGLNRLGRLAALWGFPLFSLGILAGFLWADSALGRALSWDVKEIVSLMVWLGYGLLFVLSLAGRQGRKTAWLAVLIFSLSMFSLFVVNIFLPSHHSFMPAVT